MVIILSLCRLLVRSHRNALLSTRDFWRLLMHNDVPFSALTKAFHTIEDSHTRAEKTYKTVSALTTGSLGPSSMAVQDMFPTPLVPLVLLPHSLPGYFNDRALFYLGQAIT